MSEMPCPLCESRATWVWVVRSDRTRSDGHDGPLKLDEQIPANRICWWWLERLSETEKTNFDGYCPIPACDFHVALGADKLRAVLKERHFYWQYM